MCNLVTPCVSRKLRAREKHSGSLSHFCNFVDFTNAFCGFEESVSNNPGIHAVFESGRVGDAKISCIMHRLIMNSFFVEDPGNAYRQLEVRRADDRFGGQNQLEFTAFGRIHAGYFNKHVFTLEHASMCYNNGHVIYKSVDCAARIRVNEVLNIIM